MNWNEPLTKLKVLIDSTTSWWENEAKEHLCLRQNSIPNHVSMAYEIRELLQKENAPDTLKDETCYSDCIYLNSKKCDKCIRGFARDCYKSNRKG